MFAGLGGGGQSKIVTLTERDKRNAPTDRSEAQDSDQRTPFTTGDELLRAVLAASEPQAPSSQPLLNEGAVIADHYEILERLGAGGMGIVYLARDKRLARKVALKLIRTGPSHASVTRLVREAQAIAKLSHPNVVTVFQIGTHEDQPFVAMEYVDAGTARTWLEAKPRTWREIVALYLAAGRGLEAAHRAHLVHRDFKPDNVLVGDDGRVRVADFGLVASTSDVVAGTDDEPSGAPATATKTGTVMGTPAYMAPEQRHGGVVDAAADQYAFAVSLWEALTGARPTSSKADATTAKGDSAHSSVGAPKRPIPRHLELALRRALSPEPAARWPNMAPLLAELARDPAATRRRVAFGAGGLVAAAAIVVPLSMRGTSGPAPCTDSEATLAPVWNAERRTAIVTALGPQAGTTVGDALDGYASQWAVAHRQACVDTRLTRSQSDDMLDRRMQCLFSARAAIDATVSVLRDATAEGKAKAIDAVGRLPALERCRDIEALARDEPLPTDPSIRRKLEETSRQLAEAQVADLKPKRNEKQELLDAALARAREIGWTPLIASALLEHAIQLREDDRITEADRELREAITIAIISGQSELGARAYAELALLLGELDNLPAAELALHTARAFDDRAGPAPMKHVLMAGALVASRAQKHDEAISLATRLVASADKEPTRNQNPMTSRYTLAGTFAASLKLEKAIEVIDEAVRWGVASYGAGHAKVGSFRAYRADLLKHIGDYAAAIAEGQAALAILETWYGPDNAQLAEVLAALADANLRAGNWSQVMPWIERAQHCARDSGDADTHVAINNTRAIYFMSIGDMEHAVPATDALVASAEATRSFYALQAALLIRGNLRKDLGKYIDAERDFLRALELVKPMGEVAPVHNLRNELGRTWIALGRAAEARDMLTTQLPLLTTTGAEADPIVALETHTVLADACYVLGDKPRARTLFAVAEKIVADHPERPDLAAIAKDYRATHR